MFPKRLILQDLIVKPQETDAPRRWNLRGVIGDGHVY